MQLETHRDISPAIITGAYMYSLHPTRTAPSQMGGVHGTVNILMNIAWMDPSPLTRQNRRAPSTQQPPQSPQSPQSPPPPPPPPSRAIWSLAGAPGRVGWPAASQLSSQLTTWVCLSRAASLKAGQGKGWGWGQGQG